MSLDELLTEAREHRAEPDPGRFSASGVLALLLGSAVVAFAAYQVLLMVGYRVPYPLLFAVLVAGLVARKLTAAVHGRRQPAPVPPAPHWAHESPHDHAYYGVRQWISRLGSVEIGQSTATSGLRRRLHPAIVGLVDERLRLRHGVDRRRDPRRARALLGDELWSFVTEPPAKPPTPYQMERLAAQIETL